MKQTIVKNLTRVHQGRLVEIRAMRGKQIAAGYFYDYDKAADFASQYDRTHDIYMTLNAIHEGCHARAPDQYVDSPANTTSDKDVIRRQYLIVDIDPARPAGVSATDGEVRYAELVKEAIVTSLGRDDLICGFSGNGYHILVPDPDDTTDDVREFLACLDRDFGTIQATVDQTVHNLSRIVRLYGTTTKKGFSTATRPHRRSELI